MAAARSVAAQAERGGPGNQLEVEVQGIIGAAVEVPVLLGVAQEVDEALPPVPAEIWVVPVECAFVSGAFRPAQLGIGGGAVGVVRQKRHHAAVAVPIGPGPGACLRRQVLVPGPGPRPAVVLLREDDDGPVTLELTRLPNITLDTARNDPAPKYSPMKDPCVVASGGTLRYVEMRVHRDL